MEDSIIDETRCSHTCSRACSLFLRIRRGRMLLARRTGLYPERPVLPQRTRIPVSAAAPIFNLGGVVRGVTLSGTSPWESFECRPRCA